MTRIDALVAGLIAAFSLAVAGCATDSSTPRASTQSGAPPLPELDAQQRRGYEFAVRRCSGCHTVGLDDGAADGPAFYRLARRCNPISLERRFAEVSAHGFESMPAISFTAAEAADLIAYFDTLQGN